MVEQDKIEKILQNRMGNDSQYTFVLSSTQSLGSDERQALVEKITSLMTVGQACHLCGGVFDPESALTARKLGPLGSNRTLVDAHESCFTSRLEENPYLQELMGKPWSELSDEEKLMWARAFASTNPDS